jgi:transcription initiation factor TFIIIB Brf1 subunit/transcription initiation factor TFIIB
MVRAGSSTPHTKKRKEPFHFCRYCGLQTVYMDAYYAFYCQRCGTIVDEINPEEKATTREQQQQQQESTYTIADGSQPYSPDVYTRSNIKHGKTFAIPPAGSSGRTMAIRRSDVIAERLRMKDGRSRELDRVLQQQDRQMESMGRTILEDRLELRRSSNVKSSDELRAEKSGNVGLSGAGRYKPATGKRPRLSF